MSIIVLCRGRRRQRASHVHSDYLASNSFSVARIADRRVKTTRQPFACSIGLQQQNNTRRSTAQRSISGRALSVTVAKRKNRRGRKRKHPRRRLPSAPLLNAPAALKGVSRLDFLGLAKVREGHFSQGHGQTLSSLENGHPTARPKLQWRLVQRAAEGDKGDRSARAFHPSETEEENVETPL